VADIVHIAAIPQEKEQRCLRCLRKLIDIDPVTQESFQPLAFVVQTVYDPASKLPSGCEIQESDAGPGQIACKGRGRPQEKSI